MEGRGREDERERERGGGGGGGGGNDMETILVTWKSKKVEGNSSQPIKKDIMDSLNLSC